jgi:hypothetical protein
MSIERLNKAASAAGFAMATPDDEAATETAEREAAAPSRAVIVNDQASRLLSAEAQSRISNWLKGYLPGFGGRQPA